MRIKVHFLVNFTFSSKSTSALDFQINFCTFYPPVSPDLEVLFITKIPLYIHLFLKFSPLLYIYSEVLFFLSVEYEECEVQRFHTLKSQYKVSAPVCLPNRSDIKSKETLRPTKSTHKYSI